MFDLCSEKLNVEDHGCSCLPGGHIDPDAPSLATEQGSGKFSRMPSGLAGWS